MNHQPDEKPDGAKFRDGEVFIAGKGWAKRCKATTKSGTPCSNPARKGFDVCKVHGAGSKKREEEGERRPPGRPRLPERALDGEREIERIMRELQAANADPDGTDEEAIGRKALWRYLLNLADPMQARVESLEKLTDMLRKAAEDARDEAGEFAAGGDLITASLVRADAVTIARGAGDALRLAQLITSWVDRLGSAFDAVLTNALKRADIRAKQAEIKALERMVAYVQEVSHIVWDLMPEERLDAFEERLERDVLGKLGVPRGAVSRERVEA
jgi:hypothetical protein